MDEIVPIIVSHNLENNSFIEVKSCVLHIVTEPNGGIRTIHINTNNIINEIKDVIEEETNIPKIVQRLFYSCYLFHRKQFQDSQTVSENTVHLL